MSVRPGQTKLARAIAAFLRRSGGFVFGCGLATAALGSASAGQAQGVERIVLGGALDSLSRRFSTVSGVYELPSGRVVFVDSRERLVVLGDFAKRTATELGRHGAGPGEYLLPTRVFRLPGDSVAIVDDAQRRVLILDPDGAIVGLGDLELSGQAASTRVIRRPALAFVDSAGFRYGQAPPIDRSQREPQVTDSAALERWRGAGDRSDTVGYVALARDPSRTAIGVGGGVVVTRPRSPNPFPAADEWTVCWDGRVAIARVAPYRLEYRMVSGERITGPAVAYDPVRVTNALKDLWRKERRRTRQAIVHRDAASPPQVVEVSEPLREPATWPEFLPPFLRGAVSCAADGSVWVKRTTAAEEVPSFDVFDRSGNLARKVELPPHSRLVGFGRAHVYLVRFTEDEEEILVRHALRGLSPSRR